MASIKLFASLFLLSFTANVNGQCSNCYDQCFVNCPYGQACDDIFEMVNRLKTLKSANGHGGMAFIFDGTENSQTRYNYQRKLAALAAATLPIGRNTKECDVPLYFTQYHQWFYYSYSTLTIDNACQDTCQFYDFLLSSPSLIRTPQSYPLDWPANGCRMTKIQETFYSPCPSKNVMLVGFFNSRDQVDVLPRPSPFPSIPSFCTSQYPGTRALVQTSPINQGGPVWPTNNPSPFANIELFYTSTLDRAASYLTSCVKRSCCGRSSWKPQDFPTILFMTRDDEEVRKSDNPEETLARLAEEEREYVESGRAQKDHEAIKELGEGEIRVEGEGKEEQLLEFNKLG